MGNGLTRKLASKTDHFKKEAYASHPSIQSTNAGSLSRSFVDSFQSNKRASRTSSSPASLGAQEDKLCKLHAEPLETLHVEQQAKHSTDCHGADVQHATVIRNLDTGEVRDIFQPMDDDFLGAGKLRRPSLETSPWEGWFEAMRTSNEDLWKEAREGNATKLRELLSVPLLGKASVDARSEHGFTALHMAAGAGHDDCVELLLSVRADIDARSDEDFTALHLSSQFGHAGVCHLLLNAGCDGEAQTAQGDLPLHLAVVNDRQAVLPRLLEGTDARALHVRNQCGLRPVDLCMDVATAAVFRASAVLNDPYMRATFPHDSVLLRNSRADSVRRLLQPAAAPVTESLTNVLHFGGGRREAKQLPKRFTTPRPDVVEDVGPDSFRMKAVLGRGAFGEVYKVTHKSSGNVYAMKVLRKSKIVGRNLVRYAVTERNLLSYIRHPFIVRLHFAFQTRGTLALVLQFCPNGDVASAIKVCRRLSHDSALLYLAEVLLAMEHLHDRQVVYRDLKPENVLLDEDNHAILADFGLSKEGIDGLGATSLCGSTAYMAPEILTRKGHGTSVDIYGMGVFFYEMLCGFTPYHHIDHKVLMRNIASGQLHIPELVPSVSESLIQMLMCREPAQRLGSQRTSDIRTHAVFKDVNFEKVLHRAVPVPPLMVARRRKDLNDTREEDRLEAKVWSSWCAVEEHVQGWAFSGFFTAK
uniref:Protein kinase domain-containing protein n=1 Tax=Noctiluca scintillans TaxID=2966 RepID=A0A7S1FDM5_NOCSC|eukprot:CAMPEP_0194492672 /NCGR_PEP_ID=MMETSP0253-20130528/11147_1 /TAXON_ID=2966 /ORGANISM="Noctiluca scintillans" /LENGTH=697 /DNA_ID=CAMNT_0039333569 /DNA_START=54 /DNA_END=2147 /DNA_ORIENTATION=-